MGDQKGGVKLLISIVERGQGKMLSKIYEKNGLSCQYRSVGMGTASSELLDVIGFGSTERDIIFSFGATGIVNRLMHKLNDESEDSIEAKGIAFDISLSGMNAIIAAVLMNGEQAGNGGGNMEQKGSSSLILVIVNQGYTDDVMNTARGAGARGGTIIRSRWVGEENVEKFYGISFQAEKEMIFIVATGEKRNAIMETINLKHGLDKEAGAMVCSFPIDQIQRLG